MHILKFRSDEELNEAGAGIITGLVRTNPKAVLGLATGGTPVGIPKDHPESYHSYMKRHLFDHVDLQPENTHIPDGNAPDLEAECARYDQLLEKVGRIDLQLLGIGHNGHIGFNEPGGALCGGTHVVRLREETRQANARFFNSVDEVPTHALTMGVGAILKAKTILLVVRGADKAEIVHRALTGPITTECPASLLQTHAHVVVLLDSESGRLFP